MDAKSTKITEKEFTGQVKDLAVLLGWKFYHPWLAIHSERGWPDVTLVRPPRIIFAELKSEKGKVTDKQQAWLDILREVPGVEVFVWRPTDADWEEIKEALR